MKDQELPKWFTKGGGVCYKKGSAVKNPFTGESTELTNVELSLKVLYILNISNVSRSTANILL